MLFGGREAVDGGLARAPGERRVVISGMGAVCASGVGAQTGKPRDGVAQIRELEAQRPYDGRIKIAAQVSDFNPADYIEPNVLAFCDPFTQFCVVAADEAMAQAGFAQKDVGRTAVIIGSGIGGMTTNRGRHLSLLCRETAAGDAERPEAHSERRPDHARHALFGARAHLRHRQRLLLGEPRPMGLGLKMMRQGLADRAMVGGSEACVICDVPGVGACG